MERRKGEINEGLPIIRGEFGQTPVGPGRDSWSICSRAVLHVTLRSHSKFEDLTSTLKEQKHMVTWHTTLPPREDSNNEDQILWSRKDVDWSAASSAQNGRGYHSISPRCYGDISNFSTGLSFCSSLGAKLNKFTLTSGVVWGSVLCKFFLGGWLVTS